MEVLFWDNIHLIRWHLEGKKKIQKYCFYTEGLLHQSIICEGNALFPDSAMTTLVDELTNRLQVGESEETIGHKGYEMNTNQDWVM